MRRVIVNYDDQREVSDSRARCKKMFILTVLGFILGALLTKAGLGLMIGSFLGAAMEI